MSATIKSLSQSPPNFRIFKLASKSLRITKSELEFLDIIPLVGTIKKFIANRILIHPIIAFLFVESSPSSI